MKEVYLSSGRGWIVEQELCYELVKRQVMSSPGNTLEAVVGLDYGTDVGAVLSAA